MFSYLKMEHNRNQARKKARTQKHAIEKIACVIVNLLQIFRQRRSQHEA